MKLFKCYHCGNVAWKMVDAGPVMHCCGEAMKELIPGTTDGAREKHIPYVTETDSKTQIQIGSVTHPMLDEHYIAFIAAERNEGKRVIVDFLKPGEEPKTEICGGIDGLTAYEYCNLHGFWKWEK